MATKVGIRHEKRFCLLEGVDWMATRRTCCDADERPTRFQECVGFHVNQALTENTEGRVFAKTTFRAAYGRQGFLGPQTFPCFLTGWGTFTNER